jgi:hypothetical protein
MDSINTTNPDPSLTGWKKHKLQVSALIHQAVSPATALTAEQIREVVNTVFANVTITDNAIRAALPVMVNSGWARVIDRNGRSSRNRACRRYEVVA